MAFPALLIAVATGAAPASAPAAPASARVSYLAGPSVYVEAGRMEGLAPGDTLEVRRDGVTVARLRVTFLSTHRAACDTFAVQLVPRIGDGVRFTPHAIASEPSRPGAAAVSGDSSAAPAPRLATARPRGPRSLRGRVGVDWLEVHGGASHLAQPSLDLWIDGTNLGGSHADLAVDVRARRTSRAVSGGATETDGSARAYRLAVATHDAAGRLRLTLGRQSSPLLASVNLFDGALVEATGRRVSLGLFGGTEPDPVRLAPGSDVIESGGFLQIRQAPQSARRWTLAAGGVASATRGQVNRQFAFAQGFYRDRGLSLSAAQEVDVNTGWKRATGEPLLSATSTFITTHLDAGPAVSLQAGYDNRRNVLLYRDRATAETEFDDRYRQGAWGGVSVDPWRALRVGGELRASTGGGERSDAWSATGELWRVLPLRARLRGRYSQSRGGIANTRLITGSLGLDALWFAHLEAGGGTRATTNVAAGLTEQARWEDLSLDLTLARRLFLSGSIEWTAGGLETSRQADARLSWRF